MDFMIYVLAVLFTLHSVCRNMFQVRVLTLVKSHLAGTEKSEAKSLNQVCRTDIQW